MKIFCMIKYIMDKVFGGFWEVRWGCLFVIIVFVVIGIIFWLSELLFGDPEILFLIIIGVLAVFVMISLIKDLIVEAYRNC